MSGKAFEKLMQEVVDENKDLSLKDCLEEIFYDNGNVWINSYRKHFHIDEIMELLAKHKDVEGIDWVEYAGEDPGDLGRYYIDVGRWCYVPATFPPPPEDPDGWTPVKVDKKIEKTAAGNQEGV